MQNIQAYKRKHCTNCQYPQSTCLCAWISPICSPQRIIILQHPKETKHAKNTVKLLQLGLYNIDVIQGETPADFKQLLEEVQLNPTNFSLCYPNINSIAIESTVECSPETSLYNNEHTLLFIDASWRKALKIWHLNSWLHQLQSWHFDTPPVNQYQIRKTTQNNSLSTLESVAYMLKMTKKVDCKQLLTLLEKMQEKCFLGNIK